MAIRSMGKCTDKMRMKIPNMKKKYLYMVLFLVLAGSMAVLLFKYHEMQKEKQASGSMAVLLLKYHEAQKEKQALRMYQEFLTGERKVGEIDIFYLITPTGEPERQYGAEYAIVDVNGDGIPELNILSGREYTIYSCRDNEMFELEAFYSGPWRYVLLNNGAFIYRSDEWDSYYYFEMDDSGNRINELKFSWTDVNQNYLYDDDDAFMFDGNPCTKDEWYAGTRKYLFTDEEGREQIRNQAEWVTLCEQIWHSDYEMPEIASLIAGDFYMITLCRDKTVWSWGYNAAGKLGMDIDYSQYPQKVEGLEGVVKIVDGGNNVYALLETGEVYTWGKKLESMFLYTEERQYTPVRLEGLENIVDIDAKANFMFALDADGNLYTLGLQCFINGPEADVRTIFNGRYEELGKDIKRIFAGAGNYHYFLRKDGTIFSIMDYWYDGHGYPYAFIFPSSGEGGSDTAVQESCYMPEELEAITILNENTKMGYTVYYDVPGICGVDLVSSDDYTVFISKTDGTLWYWDSDRIKYHDDLRALANPEDGGKVNYGGKLVEVPVADILKTDGEASACPRIIAMQSGLENTVFLTDTGEVFISRYITCKTEDVSFFVRENPDVTRLPSVLTIEDMKLKKLTFEKLRLKNIVSISTDGKYVFSAVDVNGAYYTIK